MCHGGAGTVLASLHFAVPIVIVPRGTPSQLRMADACHAAGVGRPCDPDGIEAALDEALGGPAQAAAANAASAIASMPTAAEVVPHIEAVARE